MPHVRLATILRTMQLPDARRRDYGWLMRNLAINNGDHPDLEEALSLARFMHRVSRRM